MHGALRHRNRADSRAWARGDPREAGGKRTFGLGGSDRAGTGWRYGSVPDLRGRDESLGGRGESAAEVRRGGGRVGGAVAGVVHDGQTAGGFERLQYLSLRRAAALES